jgi:hypothetical protein
VVQGIRDALLELAEMIDDDSADFDPGEPDSYQSFSLPPSPHYRPSASSDK